MRVASLRHLPVIMAVLLGALGGCAPPPPANDPDAVADYKETNDPLEPTNRAIYAFNNGLDTVLLRPAAQAYRFVIPQPVRTGIHNVLNNLGTPVELSNDMLEGKPRRAGVTRRREERVNFGRLSELPEEGVLPSAASHHQDSHRLIPIRWWMVACLRCRRLPG